MQHHIRAIVAAAAHAVIKGRKVAGIYDHETGRHLRIAAECRGNRVQALDGERNVCFGGNLPELFDEGDQTFISLEVGGMTARGYDRGSATAYEANVGDHLVQLYDHGEGAWFSFAIRLADDASDPHPAD
jgi:hypothetical protein